MDYYGRFILGGHSSEEWGMSISGAGTYNFPRRARELVSIPGRSGALIRDLGYYENIDISYNVTILENFEQNIRSFMNFLQSQTGYIRLEDTYHPDVYRQVLSNEGISVDAIRPDYGMPYKGGNFVLTLTCKPQAYLKTGETPIIVTDTTLHSIVMQYTSNPIIHIYKENATDEAEFDVWADKLNVRYKPIFESGSGYTEAVFDCDRRIIYSNADDSSADALEGINYYIKDVSKNVNLYGQDLPTYNAGTLYFRAIGTFERVEIIPQWWQI